MLKLNLGFQSVAMWSTHSNYKGKGPPPWSGDMGDGNGSWQEGLSPGGISWCQNPNCYEASIGIAHVPNDRGWLQESCKYCKVPFRHSDFQSEVPEGQQLWRGHFQPSHGKGFAMKGAGGPSPNFLSQTNFPWGGDEHPPGPIL